jgi:hypothetical protein
MNDPDLNSSFEQLNWLQKALLAIVGGSIFIFVMLLPRFPTTPIGWCIEVGGSVLMCLWMLISGSAIAWLQRQKKFNLLFKTAAVLVALSPGGAMIYLLGSHIELIASNFQ